MDIEIAKLEHTSTATVEQIRQVWELVSREPNISINQLRDATGIQRTKVHYILKFLERARYIKHSRYLRARTVVIPLVAL